jgi:hypothetical protein
VLREGPPYIARGVSFLAGVAIPLVVARMLRPGQEHLLQLSRYSPRAAANELQGLSIDALVPFALLFAVIVAVVLVRLHGRVAGWRVALAALALLAIYSVVT